MDDNLKNEALKAAPGVGVSSAPTVGITLPEWVSILTIIYLSLQIFFLLRKEYRKRRGGGGMS